MHLRVDLKLKKYLPFEWQQESEVPWHDSHSFVGTDGRHHSVSHIVRVQLRDEPEIMIKYLESVELSWASKLCCLYKTTGYYL